VAKYADHCPLYRQAQILARQGIAIERATLAFWALRSCLGQTRVAADARELLSSTKLFVDETTAPVLDPRRGRTKRGYFWVLGRDDRPWRGGAPPAVVYSYAPGRGGDHAAALLQGYTGVLQTDGYAAYLNLPIPSAPAGRPRSRSVGHIWRRQWFDLAKSPPAPIAKAALDRIGQLYGVEETIKGLPPEHRRRERQQRSKRSPRRLPLGRTRPHASSLANPNSPPPSAMRSTDGTGCCGSSTTVAWLSTTTRPSGPCVALR
jgi:transposase